MTTEETWDIEAGEIKAGDVKTRVALMFSYVHLPQKIAFLANPPKDITKDKYNDLNYLIRCVELIKELKPKDFGTRKDGVGPYEQEVLVKHFVNRIETIKKNKGGCDCGHSKKEHTYKAVVGECSKCFCINYTEY